MKLVSLWGKLDNLSQWGEFVFLNKREQNNLQYTYGLRNKHSWNDVITFEIEGSKDISNKEVRKFLDIEVSPYRI